MTSLSPLQLAKRYLDIFYNEGELAALAELFHPHLRFEGPFFNGTSASAYLDSLAESPPQNMDYEIISAFENDHEACVIYQFSKQDISTPMAQWFKVEQGKISHIKLIFDTSVF